MITKEKYLPKQEGRKDTNEKSKAVKAKPDAHPLFYSSRGFQYTSKVFHHKLQKAGMTQSMSRVAHCIDDGPVEGFWGILKWERYCGRRFTSKHDLVQMIENYIEGA